MSLHVQQNHSILLPTNFKWPRKEISMPSPMLGPVAVIRTDGVPGFASLQNDAFVCQFNLAIEVGHPKKKNNHNPVAEVAAECAIQKLNAVLL